MAISSIRGRRILPQQRHEAGGEDSVEIVAPERLERQAILDPIMTPI
jgi:hypothetical protein